MFRGTATKLHSLPTWSVSDTLTILTFPMALQLWWAQNRYILPVYSSEEGDIIPGQAKSSFWPRLEWRWHKGRVTGHPSQPPHSFPGCRVREYWGVAGRAGSGRGPWDSLSDRTSTVTITNCAWPASFTAWWGIDVWKSLWYFLSNFVWKILSQFRNILLIWGAL